MALPVNIEKLIHGGTVEWERIEFKSGWNPEEIIHTMCAFANDLHNWGGGYIIVGIGEKDGKPELPPAGLAQNSLDGLQKKVIELGYQIQPYYHPIMQPYVLDGSHILVLWCPAGDSRMYTAPTTLGGKSQRQPYIRVGTENIVAKGDNLGRLMELTARNPFDDRINNQAKIDNFDLALIQAYLQEVKSDLYAESVRMSLEDLAKAMYIVKGANEDLRPVNVGLLFFFRKPEEFFPRSWIELVWHKDGSGQRFEEHYFKGPLHHQLRDAMSFIRTNIIAEKVIKHSDRMEATRFYNFPLVAIEETLSNAVYHKSYERQSPIEVQVWADKIEILSFPGPVPPVNAKVLESERRIVTREYRNRRIGDFLKELELTEGRGTGFPAVYNALEVNGSPMPIFKTDENSSYFLSVIPAHPEADKSFSSMDVNRDKHIIFSNLEDIVRFTNGATNGATNGVDNNIEDILDREVHDRVREILTLLQNRLSRGGLFEMMGLTNQSYNREKFLDPLISLGWIKMAFPDKINNPKQTYMITDSGKRVLALFG